MKSVLITTAGATAATALEACPDRRPIRKSTVRAGAAGCYNRARLGL